MRAEPARGRWRRRQRIGASADDLARPWRSAGYCVLDLETTGLDLRRDEICAYGAVFVDDGRIRCSSTRYEELRPGRAPSVPAIRVHALLERDLADAPPLASAIPTLRSLLEGRVLVAHAAWIERAFLNRAFRPFLGMLGGAVVDTAGLARAARVTSTDRRREPSLEWLAGRLGLTAHSPHHALGDALTTAEAFLALASRLDHTGELSVGDLVYLSGTR